MGRGPAGKGGCTAPRFETASKAKANPAAPQQAVPRLTMLCIRCSVAMSRLRWRKYVSLLPCSRPSRAAAAIVSNRSRVAASHRLCGTIFSSTSARLHAMTVL